MHERLQRVKDILKSIPHAAMATVNDDGSPLNTPVFCAFDKQLHMFWSSSPRSMHSRNIERAEPVFVVVFDSVHGHGGLYMSGRAEQIREESTADAAYEVLRAAKVRLQAPMGTRESYGPDGPQRLYRLTPERFWISRSTKDNNGAIIFDQRVEVTLSELVG